MIFNLTATQKVIHKLHMRCVYAYENKCMHVCVLCTQLCVFCLCEMIFYLTATQQGIDKQLAQRVIVTQQAL